MAKVFASPGTPSSNTCPSDNKPINKAAYKQAALQIAAGIRRLERAERFLINQSWNAEARFRLSEAIDEANKALSEARRLANG